MKLPETTADGNVYAGTFGGMILSVFSNLFIEDLLRTIVLAIVGTIVSFVISIGLKFLIRRFKR
ncbi:hypothetical protein SDC9_198489 [bioreactor metagenome]|jgi:ABC-type phosphate/phosphonate transport system permease subunit|uniref:Uncharacterized protein n=1 Tax=bioreactor metagenome TaxID=1076179 RepID=A0A645IK64_9ZZZZ|nr:hypothetical protein [Paludibacter sp.]